MRHNLLLPTADEPAYKVDRKPTLLRRVFSAFLVGVCLINTAVAAPSLKPPAGAAADNPLVLLRRMASVNPIPASRGPSKGTVYHIQDVHGHAPTQQKISQIIRLLLRNGTVSTVALEGGFGPIPLRELRKRFSKTTRQKVADDFLRRGLIAGPMHALLSEDKGEAFGIDDVFHHARNRAAYIQAQSQRKLARDVWRKSMKQLQREKQAVFNPLLHVYDARIERYHQGLLPLNIYAETVWGGDRTRYPHTYRFLAACYLSSANATRPLHRLAGTVMGSYVNAVDLMRELSEQEKVFYDKLATAPSERELVMRSRAHVLEARLIGFKLTRLQWNEYVRSRNRILSPFETFYAEAVARDEAMSRRLLPALHGSAIVVTGGFHAAPLDASLSKAGYRTLVLTPRVEGSVDGASAVGVGADASARWEWTVRSADQTLAAPVWSAGVETAFVNNAMIVEPTARATFNSLDEARITLMDDDAPLTRKMWALAYIQENPQSADLRVLLAALLKYKSDEDFAPLIIEAMVFLRRNSVLKEKALEHDSVIGIIWKAVDEFYPSRSPFKLTAGNHGGTFELSFHFSSGESFVFSDQVIEFMNELYNRKNSHTQPIISIHDDTDLNRQPAFNRGRVIIKLQVTHATLTDYQRGLGMLDFAKDNLGYYRLWTTNELVDKIESRARLYLDGLDSNSDEYNELKLEVYGDGTDENPGMLNILRNRKKYGSRPLIPVESLEDRVQVTTFKRRSVRIDVESLLTMARYLPVFTHFIPEGDIQRWIFLARGAGSHFNTAFLKGLLRGHVLSDHMAYVSTDTLGPVTTHVREKMGELSGVVSHLNAAGDYEDGDVGHFRLLQLSIMNWMRTVYQKTLSIEVDGVTMYVKLRKTRAWFDSEGKLHERLLVFDSNSANSRHIATLHRISEYDKTIPGRCIKASINTGVRVEDGGVVEMSRAELRKFGLPPPESDELFIYAVNALYQQQFRSTPILGHLKRVSADGKPLVPRVCVVDEYANGTFDFIVKFALEEISRHDEEKFPPSEELRAFRNRDPYKIKDMALIDRWERLEQAQNARRASEESVDVELFFGATRGYAYETPFIDGSPTLRTELLMEHFGMSEDEAAQAIEATTKKADVMPHPYKLDLKRVKGVPVLDSVPIEMEAPTVQLAAYLKDLLIYNGVIRYYQQNYIKLVGQPLLKLLGDADTPASVKHAILEILPWFDFTKVLKGLVAQTQITPSIKSMATQTALDMFQFMLSDAIAFGHSSAPVQLRNIDFVERYQRLLQVLSEPNNPFIGLQYLARACTSVCAQGWSSFVFVGVPYPTYRDISYFVVSELRRKGKVLVPLMSETPEQQSNELSQRINEYRPLEVPLEPLRVLYSNLDSSSNIARLLQELSRSAAEEPLSDNRRSARIDQLIFALNAEVLHQSIRNVAPAVIRNSRGVQSGA